MVCRDEHGTSLYTKAAALFGLAKIEATQTVNRNFSPPEDLASAVDGQARALPEAGRLWKEFRRLQKLLEQEGKGQSDPLRARPGALPQPVMVINFSISRLLGSSTC